MARTKCVSRLIVSVNVLEFEARVSELVGRGIRERSNALSFKEIVGAVLIDGNRLDRHGIVRQRRTDIAAIFTGFKVYNEIHWLAWHIAAGVATHLLSVDVKGE